MLSPSSINVNNFSSLSVGLGNRTPHFDPGSGHCTMETSTRFVVKPDGVSNVFVNIFDQTTETNGGQ